MEEILELRKAIQEGRYAAALLIVDEMNEMAKDDKTDKIFSFMEILLIHLIKRDAENRLSRSWTNSINHSVVQIKRVNKRRSSGGFYMNNHDLMETLHEAFELALPQAAEEAFGGALNDKDLLEKIDKNKIIAEAMRLIEN